MVSLFFFFNFLKIACKYFQTFLLPDRIRPICLPLYEPLRSSDLTGSAPFVAGWGSTSYQGPQSSILRETQVTIVPISKCEQSYKAAFPSQVFDDRIICAGDGGHDTCQGDSGKCQFSIFHY